MSRCRLQLFVILIFLSFVSVQAQTHVSVPLGDPVYHILELAELRGLCSPLPTAKPYSRSVILTAINEILSSDEGRRFGRLGESERRILENTKVRYSNAAEGFNLSRGVYQFKRKTVSGAGDFSAALGVKHETLFSGALYTGEDTDFYWGTENWLSVYFNGDLGSHFSYQFLVSGGIMRSPREELGKYNTYYAKYSNRNAVDLAHQNERIITYSEPLAYFPYTYKKRWDTIWSFQQVDASGMISWPQSNSLGYSMMPEMGGAFLGDHITYRIGRIDREWGAMSNGNSLVFNSAAQPFLAFEATATPFSWLNFSALTGVLEYNNTGGITVSSASNQNAFSQGMVEVNIKNYVHVDFGSSVIWPKRFELGYLFPLADNFFYQNNIGDFDNLAFFGNIKGQYPGIANLWFSLFLDEINPESGIFKMDRAMFAYQAGTTVPLPIPALSFGSLTLSYTKIEPYVYTHPKQFVPWYGDTPMEQAYTNNGKGLGYYLPPNSDELKLRFEAMPEINTRVNVQYQMIRHGADFGPHAVDGSSYLSELDPEGRSDKAVLKKFFLEDGAYQWLHIIKVGAEYSFPIKGATPFTVFGEAGVVISYFTDIAGDANSGSAFSYSVVDTDVYPKSTGFILTLGIRIFP
ncbi:hypothetical protein AGMMS49942_19310 [Spirochaetia bacterium]|nr:hypothetical protein AGMMS49942_19310 [Spirochaetia bacterium]